MNFRNPGVGQLARFLETVSAYLYKVIHRRDRVHMNADALSRRPCYDNNCQHCACYESRYSDENVAEANLDQRETTSRKMYTAESASNRETGCNAITENRDEDLVSCETCCFRRHKHRILH